MVGTKDFEKRTVLKIFGMNCFTRQLHCYKRAVTFVALAAKPTLNVHCIAYIACSFSQRMSNVYCARDNFCEFTWKPDSFASCVF